MKKIIIALVISAIAFSCSQEEEPTVDTRPEGGTPVDSSGNGSDDSTSIPNEIDKSIKSGALSFEEGYANQIFFDLEQGQLISEVDKEEYEFLFETTTGGSHVKLNSSLYMGAVLISGKTFDEISFTESADWKYDSPDGDLYKLAIDLTKAGVYLVLGGYNAAGDTKANIKIEVEESESAYQVKCQKEGSLVKTYTVSNDGTPWTALSVDEGVKYVYPQDYDLLFSHYTHIYEDGTTYLVTGVLINGVNNSMSVAELVQEDFESISIDDVVNLSYSTDLDEIGFEWKSYSLDTHTYTMQPENVFVVKKNDKYFKLRFVGFNKNISGGRDAIFEHARLK